MKAKGFAVLTVIFVMVIFAVLGTAAVALITGSAQMMTDEYLTQKAFYVAEAGLQYTAGGLKGDTDWSDNAGETKTFGPGSFTTTFLAQTSSTATVQSVGTVGGVARRMQVNFTAGMPEAFKNGIYTEQEVIVSGSSFGDVYGPISAGSDVDESAGVVFHDAIEENNPDASIPTPDWAYWQSVASTVISGNYTFNPGTYSGIYYITGNVTLKQNMTLNGSIIARGRVSANSNDNISIVATAPSPAIFAEDRITINGCANLNIIGWVLSLADITLSGNSDVTGTGGFSAGGDITFSGNTEVDLTFNIDYAPSSESVTGGEVSGLTFTNWKETF